MKYLIDTADKDEIKKWLGFIEGVTCNPILLNKVGISEKEYCANNIELFDNIFVQVNSLDDVTSLNMFDRDQLIFKVPLLIDGDYDGYTFLKLLLQLGYRTCSTIVYDIAQFDFACSVGSEFSIVLYAKNLDNNFLIKCCELKEKKKYKTKIVAASFRNVEQVFNCINLGVDYSTIPPNILKKIFRNRYAIGDYYKFYGD